MSFFVVVVELTKNDANTLNWCGFGLRSKMVRNKVKIFSSFTDHLKDHLDWGSSKELCFDFQKKN